jgi:hypothetical protein
LKYVKLLILQECFFAAQAGGGVRKGLRPGGQAASLADGRNCMAAPSWAWPLSSKKSYGLPIGTPFQI